jgi:hypothetical protein
VLCPLFVEKFDALRFVISKESLALDIVRSSRTSRGDKKELDLALGAIEEFTSCAKERYIESVRPLR